MRDDSLAAGAIGAPVPILRMTAFVLSSLYGGVAGVLYAGLIRYVAPETFSIANMFLLLAMVIIGGRQSILGCVVGAIVLSLVREALVDFSVYAQLGFGAVVVLMVVFAPTGLAGIPSRLRQLVRRRRAAGERATLRPFQPGSPVAGESTGASLEISGISKHFRGLQGALGGVHVRRARRDPRHRRAERLGQDDAVQRRQRDLPGVRGQRVGQRSRRHRAALPPALPVRPRADLPEPAAVRPDGRPGQRPGRARPLVHVVGVAVPAVAGRRLAYRARPAQARGRAAGTLRPRRLRRRRATLAALRHPAPGRDRPGHGHPARRCCSSTSRPPGSTARRSASSARSSGPFATVASRSS